jgi:FAD synthase
MDVVHGVEGLARAHGRLFVVVGVFDGLHRGHHYLLARLREAARSHRARPAVITFDAHPDEIVLGHAPPLLLDPEERLARLASAGVEVTVVQHFDAALRMTEYDVFVGRIAEHTSLAGFLMTPDAAFGHDRRGTPTTLTELGARMSFEVVVVPPFSLEGHPVRSRAIREAIAAGDLATARHLLGRPMSVTGDLADGAMAFPIPVALPPDGTYRVTVEPAWTVEGRSAPPRLSSVTVAGDHVELLRPGGGTDPRVRVAFGPRLPEEGNPAILRRSQKKTSK